MSSDFALTVYAYARQIPEGKVTTYKRLATAAGKPQSYRAVGKILSINPYAPYVPCHRVISAQGKLSGFFGSKAEDSTRAKLKLLESEGVTGWKEGKLLDMKSYLFEDFQPVPHEKLAETLKLLYSPH